MQDGQLVQVILAAIRELVERIASDCSCERVLERMPHAARQMMSRCESQIVQTVSRCESQIVQMVVTPVENESLAIMVTSGL